MNVSIGQAREQDLEFVILTSYETFKDTHGFASLEDVEEYYGDVLECPSKTILMLRLDDTPIGYLVYHKVEETDTYRNLEGWFDYTEDSDDQGEGFCVISRKISEINSEDYFIKTIYVLPEYRRQGHGLALTEYLCTLVDSRIFAMCIKGRGSQEMMEKAEFVPIIQYLNLTANGQDCTLVGRNHASL